MTMQWLTGQDDVDWNELSQLYRIAPLGEKKPADLERSFTSSLFKVFVRDGGKLVGARRALADGVDCSYLCDIAGHRKIILYANPGKEGLYGKLGFRRMLTAMAIFRDQAAAMRGGLVEAD